MTSFDGRLKVPGQSRLPMGVVVDVSDERMKLVMGDRLLGDWSLGDVTVAAAADGFHLEMDGESAVLSVADPDLFATQLGISGYEHSRPKQDSVSTSRQAQAGAVTVADRLAKVVQPTGYEDLEARLEAIERALRSNEVSPQRAFGHWLELLHELSDRHAAGTIPCNIFDTLNAKMLGMMS